MATTPIFLSGKSHGHWSLEGSTGSQRARQSWARMHCVQKRLLGGSQSSPEGPKTGRRPGNRGWMGSLGSGILSGGAGGAHVLLEAVGSREHPAVGEQGARAVVGAVLPDAHDPGPLGVGAVLAPHDPVQLQALPAGWGAWRWGVICQTLSAVRPPSNSPSWLRAPRPVRRSPLNPARPPACLTLPSSALPELGTSSSSPLVLSPAGAAQSRASSPACLLLQLKPPPAPLPTPDLPPTDRHTGFLAPPLS